jgi:dTDP-glucose 4,6-dehydratase
MSYGQETRRRDYVRMRLRFNIPNRGLTGSLQAVVSGVAMTSYLVTGGAGFIGSSLLKSLAGDSVRITVADRRSPEESPFLDRSCNNVEWVRIDLRDAEKTADLFRRTRPDAIFHLAAQPLSALSNREPLRTVQDNILATYSVLEGLRTESRNSRLVHASSACFYGVPTSAPPLRETDPPAVGHYIYTATKIAADFAVQHYRHVYHLDCISARMVNVYGPGDTNLERVVPRLVLQALQGDAPTLTQSDGSDVLSFLYIDDAVTALRVLGTHPKAGNQAVWNLAGSEPISVLDLMKKIYALVGLSVDLFATVGPRRGAPVHKYLDGTRARTSLGFSPAVDLDKGLAHSIDWYASCIRGRQEELLGAQA